MTTHEDLAGAIEDALATGLIVPCAGQAHRFTSDDLDELEEAAAECDGCPVLHECHLAGKRQTWGVWGGQVVTPSWAGRRRRKVAMAS